MNSRQLQFISRASEMAIPNAEILARTSVEIGREFGEACSIGTILKLESFCERLHHFLNFIVLAEMALQEHAVDISCALGDVKRRIFDGVEAADAALQSRNMPLVGVILTRSLGAIFLEYRNLGGHLVTCFQSGSQEDAA